MQWKRVIVVAAFGLLAISSQGCSSSEKPASVDAPTESVAEAPSKNHREFEKHEVFDEATGFKWELIEELHKEFSNNLALKHLVANKDKIDALPADKKDRVYNIAKSGLLLPHESEVGVYAQTANDYYEFDYIMQNIMYDRLKASSDSVHHEDWALDNNVNTMVGDGVKTYSLRIRVARNPKGVPLPASCEEKDFRNIEEWVGDVLESMTIPVFKTKFDEKKLETKFYTLTPDHPKAGKTVKSGKFGKSNRSTEYIYVDYGSGKGPEYVANVKKSIFSADPTEDAALKLGGINRNFPIGRATWNLSDGTTTIRIYINEEDTLRIQMLSNGNDVGNLFRDMKSFLDAFETALEKKEDKAKGLKKGDLAFANDKKMGYLASCPSNVGTGMRASAQMFIPALLKKEGYDIADDSKENEKKGAEILTAMSNSDAFKKNFLQLRGGLGEFTAPGKGGKIDLSYKKRTFVTEKEIIMKLIEAMQYTEGLEVDASKTPSLRKGSQQKTLQATK